MLLPSETSAGMERPATVTKPPPLREPPRRSTLEVAPSPPQGARICYRLDEPLPHMRTPPPAGPPPRLVAVPIQPDPYAGPPGPSGARVPSATLLSQLPPVARPPTSAGTPGRRDELLPVDIQHVGPWPHWRDILDVSAPDVDRLRETLSSVTLSSESGARVGEPVSGSGLAGAMKSALSKRAGGSVGALEWPRTDLAAQDPTSQAGGSVGAEWPRSDLAAQDPTSQAGGSVGAEWPRSDLAAQDPTSQAGGSVGAEWPRSDLAAQDPTSQAGGSVGAEWPRSDLAAQDPTSQVR